MEIKKMTVTGTRGAGLNVRAVAGSSRKEDKIGSLPDGTQVSVLAEWCKIEYQGKEAWVSKEFLIGQTVFKFDCNPLKEKVLTQRFGEDPELYKRWNLKGHHGLDFKTVTPENPRGNQDVCAVMRGTVLEATQNDNNGKFVRLVHDKGDQSVYLHLDALRVHPGQVVAAGTVIGISGSTGFITGPHLHFGYRAPNWRMDDGWMGYVDPEPFLV
jgi:murein DD-endopeptidase MepM/ murein hydrolase activator NlpD